jgi:hypothetical protein
MLPTSPYLSRGVDRAPCLSATGKTVLFAVDHAHRFVDGSRVEMEASQDEAPVIHALWRLLDAADPQHSRRRTVRENAQRLAGLVACLLVWF